MEIRFIDAPRQKWGIIDFGKPRPYGYRDGGEGRFWTGYEKSFITLDGVYQKLPAQQVGRNVIITGLLTFNSMSRGRSAANFEGCLEGEDYTFSMSGVYSLLSGEASNHRFDGKSWFGDWTIAKQGSNFFLAPVLP